MSVDTIRLIIFALAYLAIAFPRVPGLALTRPAAALIGAVPMVVVGQLSTAAAYAAIDLDVLTFLLGMLIIAAYLEIGGFFEWAAIRIVSRVAAPFALLAAVVTVSGLLSGFFMNDTVCLVLTPLIIMIARMLGLPAMPFIFAIALSSNVGSAMAITGNPQNMLIGVSSGIPYGRFLAALIVPSLGGLAIVYAVLAFLFRRQLKQDPTSLRAEGSRRDPGIPFDRHLVVLTLVVFACMLGGWLGHLSLPLVSISGAAILLLLARHRTRDVLNRVDWSLLLFFAALFVIVRGVRDVPLMHTLTGATVQLLNTVSVRESAWRTVTLVSAVMAVLSNLVSNVPAVLLWRPFITALSHPTLTWLAMAMSSTFAGNFSLLASLANLIVAERAEQSGVHIGFGQYLRVGVPVTILTILWGIATISITARYLQ